MLRLELVNRSHPCEVWGCGEMSKCEGPEAEANLRTGKRAGVVGADP